MYHIGVLFSDRAREVGGIPPKSQLVTYTTYILNNMLKQLPILTIDPLILDSVKVDYVNRLT